MCCLLGDYKSAFLGCGCAGVLDFFDGYIARWICWGLYFFLHILCNHPYWCERNYNQKVRHFYIIFFCRFTLIFLLKSVFGSFLDPFADKVLVTAMVVSLGECFLIQLRLFHICLHLFCLYLFSHTRNTRLNAVISSNLDRHDVDFLDNLSFFNFIVSFSVSWYSFSGGRFCVALRHYSSFVFIKNIVFLKSS